MKVGLHCAKPPVDEKCIGLHKGVGLLFPPLIAAVNGDVIDYVQQTSRTRQILGFPVRAARVSLSAGRSCG